MMTDQAHSQNHHGKRSHPELAQAALDERLFCNTRLQRHATERFIRNIAANASVWQEELFVADTPEEVLAQARTAHPEEKGSILIRYIPRKRWRAFMRIDGQWLVCDDGVRRPVISGEIRAADGSWRKASFW